MSVHLRGLCGTLIKFDRARIQIAAIGRPANFVCALTQLIIDSACFEQW